MTTPNVQLAPMQVTNAAGLFNAQSGGFIQGFMQPDPATRYQLTQGVLGATDTLPMISGAAIKTFIPSAINAVGGNVLRAALATEIAGFTVSNQASNGIITPTQGVPTFGSGQSIQFVRTGSNARICLGIDAGLAALLTSGTAPVPQQLSWDFVGQKLVPYAPAYAAVTITGAVWANTSGGRTTFTVGTDLTAILTAGDIIDVSGVVSTGGVGFNGSFAVVSTTSTTVVVTQASSVTPGTYTSGGTIAAGGGGLNVKVLSVQSGNSLQIVQDITTGLYKWNPNGSVALVQI